MIWRCCGFAGLISVGMLMYVSFEVEFLAPYSRVIWNDYLSTIVAWVVLLWLNLWAFLYTLTRISGMRTTGSKLQHLDKGLHTDGTVMADLSARLKAE